MIELTSLKQAVLCGALLALASAGAELGSPERQATPESPLGWRGDGTGRFPAATPPLEWYRRPKGAFNSIRVLAAKPKGAGAEGQPLNMGAVREWLVAGPFPAKDYSTALEDVTQPNEATLQAAVGEELNGKPWKVVPVSVGNQSQSWSRLVLDLALLYGMETKQESQNHPGTLDALLAYACTNLYAAEAGQVRLRIEGAKSSAWLNGAPVKLPGQYDPPPVVDLKAGWNTLVCKVPSTKRNWNISALISPVAAAGYETKNVVWMAAMPGPSWSSPLVVGSRIFINADDCTLLCLNKEDGRVLWTHETTYYHAISDEERALFPELAPKVKQLDEVVDALPAVLNAALSVDGSKTETDAALQKALKTKTELERFIRERFDKFGKAYANWANDRGYTTPTPVSDGRNVFVAYFGGSKGRGANVVACFDLDGKRIWNHFTGQTNIPEHGSHATPALCGEVLIHMSGLDVFAYEKTTGKILWQVKGRAGVVTGSTPIALKLGTIDAVLIPQLGVYRVSDGALLWKTEVPNEISSPSLVDGILYGVSEPPSSLFYALKFPAPSGDKVTPEFLVKAPWKTLTLDLPGTFTNSIIGSPLYHAGLLYVVSEGGALTVVDAKTGTAAYTHALENLNPRLTWVFTVGICTGPTLAGKNIHIRDDQSQTLVIAPGREYQELSKNVLWELSPAGQQQEAQSNPYYEGGRMYYRTQRFLYCIGEK